MRTSRLGCLTSTGIIAMLVTLAAIVVSTFLQGGMLYSPGALNAQPGEILGGVTSHAQADCNACHAAPWSSERMADRCAACHTDIAAQMFDVAKLHGLITQKSPALACGACHPEHRGPSAALTDLGGNTFPHEALGFSLNGHQQKVTREAFACRDCHLQSVSAFDPADCQSCHQQMDVAFAQAHLSEYGADCLTCHDGVDRFGKAFSHDGFPFRLAGKHAQAVCADCHASARTLADFASTPAECVSCHQKDDPHAGKFGTDCGACHKAEGWKPATFDHSLSGFPLTGAHMQVDCEKCHVNSQFAGTLSTCVSCHAEPAYHAGAFGTDCASCHSADAWSPAKFNGAHTFPLNHGESGSVSCATCHPANFTTYTCYGCHEHSELGIRAKHLKEGISDFQNCVKCHPTGREEGD